MGACSSKPKTSDFDHANATINLGQEGGEGEEDEELANCFSIRHSDSENIRTDGVGETLMDSNFDQSLCHHVEEKLVPTDDQDLRIVQLNCSEEKQSLRIISDGVEMLSEEMKDENVLLQNKPGVENGENWIHYQNKSKESTRAMVADIGDVMAADIKKELVLYNGVLHHNEENFTTFVNKLSEGNEVYAAEATGSRLQKDDSISRENIEVMQSIAIALKEGEEVSCQKIGSEKDMHIECNESINKATASNNNGDVEETADIKKELSVHSRAIYHNEKDFSTFIDTFSKEHEVYETEVYAKEKKSSIPQGNTEVNESIATAELHRLSCKELIRDESKRQCDVKERIAKSVDCGEDICCSVIQEKEGKDKLRKEYWHLDMDIPPVNATVLRQSDLEHTPILRDSLVRLCSTLAEEMQEYSDIRQGKINVNIIKPVDSAPEVYAESLIRYCNTLGDTNAQSLQDSDIQVKNITKSLDSVSEVNTEFLGVPLDKDPLSIKAIENIKDLKLVTRMDELPSMNNEEKTSETNLHPELPLDILSEYTIDNMKKQNPEMQNNVISASNGNIELPGVAHVSFSNTYLLTELSVLNHINGVEDLSSLVRKGMAESIDKEMIDGSVVRSSVNADIFIASKAMADSSFESRKAKHEQDSAKEVKGLLLNEQEDKVVAIKKFNKDFQSYTAVQDNGNPNIDEILEKLASEFVRQENKYCTPQKLS